MITIRVFDKVKEVYIEEFKGNDIESLIFNALHFIQNYANIFGRSVSEFKIERKPD